MEIYLHVGEENVGPLSEEDVKAKYASGEVGPDTLGWMDTLDTWYPLSNEQFAFLGLGSAAEPEPVPAAAAETSDEPAATEPVAEDASDEPAATEPVAEQSVASGESSDEVKEEGIAVEPDGPEEDEPEPEPAPEELAATSAAFDAANAFEPRSRDELKAEMIRLKDEHAKVLLPEIGRKAVEEGIRVSGATEILNRIEGLLKKGDSPELQSAYVSYAQAIVSAGISEPALDDLIEKERRVSEDMLNLHTEAKRLDDAPKPGGALKWILLVVALLALGGIVALVMLNH